MVERQVPAYNRLKTDCVARRSVWLRSRTVGCVTAGGLSAPGYSMVCYFYCPQMNACEMRILLNRQIFLIQHFVYRS